MANHNKVNFIITGGTIDSIWDGSKDTATVAEHSILPDYFAKLIRNLKFDEEFEFSEVCMKDSRAVSDEDRKKVVETIEKSSATKIIITHGTYTMPDTARYIKQNLKRADQTIIITGSMVPIEGFDFSDGPFNLGFAYSEVLSQKTGIYVCMNAKTFSPEEVAKDTTQGKFYSIFDEKQ